MAIEVRISTTPNENAMKYTLNCNAIDSGHKTYGGRNKNKILNVEVGNQSIRKDFNIKDDFI